MTGPGYRQVGTEEVNSVADVVRKRQLVRDISDGSLQNPLGAFEEDVRLSTGAKYAIATNSCTTALYSGLLAAGIGPGDEVIVPRFTFVATAAAVLYTGADVRFADCDRSLCLSPAVLYELINDKTAAVIAVHMLGRSANMEQLAKICEEADIMLFEDVAQANGGLFGGRPLGTIGLFGAFSLGLYKTVTSGEGGVFLTNDQELYERAFSIHGHGWKSPPVGEREAGPMIGLNFRMNGITAALASTQWKKLSSIVAEQREVLRQAQDFIHTRLGIATAPNNSPDGDIGSVALIQFETDQEAAGFGKISGLDPVLSSSFHTSWSAKQFISEFPRCCGRIFECGDDQCETAGWLRKSFALSIGLEDEYLCTATIGKGLCSGKLEGLKILETRIRR